ncbi:unnamed protein product [Ilex paraguariensis]|uniref:MATH domain-containing protein n=1 Tax=Ilex paraguariensis TaxID=185542 RepID=A0ABC8QV08_9AQUA
MASSNAMLLSLVLVFVFIGPSLARPYYHGYRTVELRTICDGTINPQYCWDNLSPGYGTGTTEDCYRVADGSIDVACNSAREIHDLLGNMVESTNDPQLRTLYRSCAARYNTAIRDLEHAKKYLLSGDYQRVAYEATHALQDVSECKERFPGYSYGGGFPVLQTLPLSLKWKNLSTTSKTEACRTCFFEKEELRSHGIASQQEVIDESYNFTIESPRLMSFFIKHLPLLAVIFAASFSCSIPRTDAGFYISLRGDGEVNLCHHVALAPCLLFTAPTKLRLGIHCGELRWYIPTYLSGFISMADLFGDQDGVLKSVSDIPPTHFTLKIQLFSLLTKNNIERYTSGDFEAAGYKWKLVLYPNGNKNKNIKEHISFYLMISEVSSLHPGWEVHAAFRLFLFDQNEDNYLTLQDTRRKGRRFYGMKLEWGFDRFIPLTVFSNPDNGYLVNDTCVFGAEVFVYQEKKKAKEESLLMMKDAIKYKHTWKIEKFSKLDKGCEDSDTFNAGDQKWKIQLYPKGKGSGIGTHISLYLALADPTALPPGSKIFAEFILRILDQTHSNHDFGKATYWFSASSQQCGWPRFISLSYFNSSFNGFLVKDSSWVEAEVIVHGVANAQRRRKVIESPYQLWDTLSSRKLTYEGKLTKITVVMGPQGLSTVSTWLTPPFIFLGML